MGNSRNHDLNTLTPRDYSGDELYAVDGVTAEEFAVICSDFTDHVAEGANMSYTLPISDELWFTMTDVAYYEGMAHTFGMFTAGHSSWLEDVMEDARAKDIPFHPTAPCRSLKGCCHSTSTQPPVGLSSSQ